MIDHCGPNLLLNIFVGSRSQTIRAARLQNQASPEKCLIQYENWYEKTQKIRKNPPETCPITFKPLSCCFFFSPALLQTHIIAQNSVQFKVFFTGTNLKGWPREQSMNMHRNWELGGSKTANTKMHKELARGWSWDFLGSAALWLLSSSEVIMTNSSLQPERQLVTSDKWNPKVFPQPVTETAKDLWR